MPSERPPELSFSPNPALMAMLWRREMSMSIAAFSWTGSAIAYM
jgi:hypothetical protein